MVSCWRNGSKQSKHKNINFDFVPNSDRKRLGGLVISNNSMSSMSVGRSASYISDTTWSRRCSTETIFSLQGKETDFVEDSSDTLGSADEHVEYEPVTASEEEAPISADSSGQTDSEVIAAIVAVESVDSDLQLADSEAGSYVSDSELDLPAYWTCARCRSDNDNTRYRYCHKCFKVRKSFFPPRPRRKDKRMAPSQEGPIVLSQDSGVESHNSQEIRNSQESHNGPEAKPSREQGEGPSQPPVAGLGKATKRRADSAERTFKRPKLESQSDVESKNDCVEAAPLVKTISDPSVTIESLEAYKGYKTDAKDMCIICLTEPKTGVFVHRRVAHICCCYKCAVKVWAKAKRCPICNCKVSNVLKAVVM